ncbi:MAG TPA: phage tail protein [Candidatus Bathyarchaeia archaeon]|nr:phage tail protein [Candidatus Bathyarchaeia archaeon]
MSQRRRLLVPAVALVVGWTAANAGAVTKCSVMVRPGSGVIDVFAKGVTGDLFWGDRPGAVNHQFANAATCVAAGKATACELGATTPDITLAAITPPAQCTLYLEDSGPGCAVRIKGCTPGIRADTGFDPRFGTQTSLAGAGIGLSCVLGEVRLVAGFLAGAIPAAGQLLPISGNADLYALLRNTYGGDSDAGTFALPDLRNAAPSGLTYVICTTGSIPTAS